MLFLWLETNLIEKEIIWKLGILHTMFLEFSWPVFFIFYLIKSYRKRSRMYTVLKDPKIHKLQIKKGIGFELTIRQTTNEA